MGKFDPNVVEALAEGMFSEFRPQRPWVNARLYHKQYRRAAKNALVELALAGYEVKGLAQGETQAVSK